LCESGMWGHLCPMDTCLSYIYRYVFSVRLSCGMGVLVFVTENSPLVIYLLPRPITSTFLFRSLSHSFPLLSLFLSFSSGPLSFPSFLSISLPDSIPSTSLSLSPFFLSHYHPLATLSLFLSLTYLSSSHLIHYFLFQYF